MTKKEIEKLLGRSLTTYEDSNFNLFVKNTIATLGNLLCWSTNFSEARKYKARDNYRTVWLEPFTDITEVKVGGAVRTDYTPAFNGNYNSTLYNSIEFSEELHGETVEVTGAFDLDCIPGDLSMLIADIFKMVVRTSKNNSGNVKDKRIEDYSVTYSGTEYSALADKNKQTIAKYSNCNGEVQNGRVCSILY